jgi:hypothetical protein
MAEFLTTQGTAYHLENIIMNASKWLILICPYLNITENFLHRLQDADRRGVQICMVFGKKELNREEEIKLRKLKKLSLRFYKNLHAKCYTNEHTMIITSMNLLGFSEKTNREMGILIRKDELNDRKIYEDAISEIKSIIELSKEEDISAEVKEQDIKSSRADYASTKKDTRSRSGEGLLNSLKAILTKDVSSFFFKYGHCIRCNKQIPYDLDKPYCKECYFSLGDATDSSHVEKFCHTCGKEYNTRLNYPQCRNCYQKSHGH